MDNVYQRVLHIQNSAWQKGHENYGTKIDVQASALHFLKYFKHLNPRQKELLNRLEQISEIKYAKRLCSHAHKAVRHYIVTLK